MELLAKYEKNVPEAYLMQIVKEIQSHAIIDDKYWRAPNEIYVSARHYAILDALFKIPGLDKVLEKHGISMFYEPDIVPDPEYSFLDGGFIFSK